MTAAEFKALSSADDWMSKFWATRLIGQPDPTEVINQIREVLGRPKIVDLLKDSKAA